MENKDFITVKKSVFKTREPLGLKSRRKMKKRLKNPERYNKPLIEVTALSQLNYPALCKRTRNEIYTMKDSALFKYLINYLNAIMKSQRTDENKPITIDIICYGIGNFSKNSDALQQLALLCAIREYYIEFNEKNLFNENKEDKDKDKNKDKDKDKDKDNDIAVVDNNNNNPSKSSNNTTIDSDMKDLHPNNSSNQNNIKSVEIDEKEESSGQYVFSWERKKKEQKESEKWQKYPFILNKVELYEPLLNIIEKNLLNNVLKINVLTENNEGKYDVNHEGYMIPTNKPEVEIQSHNFVICFLPHCPRALYNNLLHTNWTKDKLSRVIIIGNSFSQYDNIALNLRESEKEDMNYILASNKMNLITEQSLDEWIVPKEQFEPDDQKTFMTLKQKNVKNKNISIKKKKKKNRSNTQDVKYLDLYQQKSIMLAKNAFAFQHIQYYPLEQLAKIPDAIWVNVANGLLQMYNSTVIDPRLYKVKEEEEEVEQQQLQEAEQKNKEEKSFKMERFYSSSFQRKTYRNSRGKKPNHFNRNKKENNNQHTNKNEDVEMK